MNYYPINLKIHGKKVTVVGGGEVASRKIQTLLKAGAEVWVIAPELNPTLMELHKKGEVFWIPREYQRGDLEGALLAFGATDDRAINQKVFQEAAERNILTNIVDNPEECDFFIPSHIQRGDLVLTVSTGGKSPALAKKIRQKLEEEFGEEYEKFLTLLGNIREQVLSGDYLVRDKKKDIFIELVDSDILRFIKEKNWEKLDEILEKMLGMDYSFTGVRSKV